MSGDTVDCHNLWERSATGLQLIEIRDAAKHHTMCRMQPTTKNFLVKPYNTEVENSVATNGVCMGVCDFV